MVTKSEVKVTSSCNVWAVKMLYDNNAQVVLNYSWHLHQHDSGA